mmetsp:Transcript_61165/g.192430  ORF Transcript_61165/g.192430 Transcript_61165/m.192430 type:complete len:294 (-) Transcript_61165:401-1282(-)
MALAPSSAGRCRGPTRRCGGGHPFGQCGRCRGHFSPCARFCLLRCSFGPQLDECGGLSPALLGGAGLPSVGSLAVRWSVFPAAVAWGDYRFDHGAGALRGPHHGHCRSPRALGRIRYAPIATLPLLQLRSWCVAGGDPACPWPPPGAGGASFVGRESGSGEIAQRGQGRREGRGPGSARVPRPLPRRRARLRPCIPRARSGWRAADGPRPRHEPPGHRAGGGAEPATLAHSPGRCTSGRRAVGRSGARGVPNGREWPRPRAQYREPAALPAALATRHQDRACRPLSPGLRRGG